MCNGIVYIVRILRLI